MKMLDTIFESVNQATGRRWLISALAPALIFWTAMACLYTAWIGFPSLLAWWDAFSDAGRTLVLLESALVIFLTAIVVDVVGAAFLKLAQGEWERIPFIGKPLGQTFRTRHVRHAQRLRQRRGELSWKWLARYQPPSEFPDLWTGREPPSAITEQEERELQRVDAELAVMPLPDTELATQLGNLLRAAAQHPQRYGLDAAITFPRLYPLLPEVIRSDLDNAQTSLDTAVRAMLLAQVALIGWGIVFFVTGALVFLIAVIVGIVVVWLSLRAAERAARNYGDVLRACYDLYRFSLYDALHWALPADSNVEKQVGEQLTAFLRRGPNALKPKGIVWHSTKGGED